MTTTFEVKQVKGKPRPRFTVRNGHPVPYADSKQKAYESIIANAYREAGGRLLTGPVSVAIGITRALPQRTPKGIESEQDTHKPDVDNVAKSVLDALNGVAYKDDSQVVGLTVTKFGRFRDFSGPEMRVIVKEIW